MRPGRRAAYAILSRGSSPGRAPNHRSCRELTARLRWLGRDQSFWLSCSFFNIAMPLMFFGFNSIDR